MNTFAVLCLLVVALAVAQGARLRREEKKYTTKYDNVDLDEILSSERLIKNYINCLLEKSSCTPDGKELKTAIPDALTNECSKCSEKQKEGSKKVIKHIIDHKPDVWAQLKTKYDPTGIYERSYQKELQAVKTSA